EDGLSWLWFLHRHGLGGILADDMGLGKTVQALALLQQSRNVEGSAPSLVVAPTSVLPNWQREAERFTPGLRVAVWHGQDRRERGGAGRGPRGGGGRSRGGGSGPHILRARPPRPRRADGDSVALRAARRGAEHQERRLGDGAGLQGAARGPSPGAHRNAAGEP